MSPRMSQGCTLVLLLAMMLALAVGLTAWGPISLQPGDHAYADPRAWVYVPAGYCERIVNGSLKPKA